MRGKLVVVRGEFFLAGYGKHLSETARRPIRSDGLSYLFLCFEFFWLHPLNRLVP